MCQLTRQWCLRMMRLKVTLQHAHSLTSESGTHTPLSEVFLDRRMENMLRLELRAATTTRR